MPQSRVQTNDVGARAEFKGQLRRKIDGALAPVGEKDPVVLLLPHNHEALSERDLLFTLTNNPELQHSQESAVLTVNLLCGRAARPAGTSFQLVELSAPVELPDIVSQAPIQRKPGTVAPGFARLVDSSPSRVLAENNKRVQFKQSLADKIHLSLTTPPKPVKEPKTVRPVVHVVDSPPAERLPAKPERLLARDVTTDAGSGDQVRLLPANYRELPESTLGFVLSHNPEFKYTPEATAQTMAVLYGRKQRPAELRFEILHEAAPQEPAPAPVEAQVETRVFTLPANFRDFSATELHAILVETYSEADALRAMQVLNGLVDTNTVLKISDDIRPVPKRPVKRSVRSQPPKVEVLAKDVTGGNGSAPNVFLLPSNYLEMSEPQLYNTLKYNHQYKHGAQSVALTLDVVFGRKAQPAELRFEILHEAAPQEPAPAPVEAQVETRVFTLPANFRDFSATELHAILVETYSEADALRAMQVLNGLVDTNTVLKISDAIRPSQLTSG